MIRHRIVITQQEIEKERGILNSKTFSCHRCKASFVTDDLMQMHRQYQHGEYAIKDSKREPNKNDIQPNSMKYDISSESRESPELKRVVLKHMEHKTICKNCGRDVFSTFELKDFFLCPDCGLNVFEDKRKQVYNWLHDLKNPGRKLPSGISFAVVDTARRKVDHKKNFEKWRNVI